LGAKGTKKNSTLSLHAVLNGKTTERVAKIAQQPVSQLLLLFSHKSLPTTFFSLPARRKEKKVAHKSSLN
jgi:hypothetical protein